MTNQRFLALCLVSPLFHPVYSGAATQFKRYLLGLGKRGFRTRVLSQTPEPHLAKASQMEVNWNSVRSGSMLPVEIVGDVPVYRVKVPDAGSIQRNA